MPGRRHYRSRSDTFDRVVPGQDGGSNIRYGKVAPVAGFSQGALTAPNNEVTEWSGLKEGTPAATAKTIECHWSTGDFSQGDAVAVTTFADGSKVVSCFPGGFT